MEENLSWTSEFSHAFRNVQDLYTFLGWEVSSPLKEVEKTYPVFIPRSLAEKIRKQGPDTALAREFLPSNLEIDQDLMNIGLPDPIGDKEYFKAPQLIHRYKNRALFTPTSICPVHCRYCFRKNELNASEEFFTKDFEKTLHYLQEHPEVSEIIFTGGDPLTLSNARIRTYLEAFATIPSIKDIRLHTRYPVILPQRLDDEFIALMSEFRGKFRTVSLAVHVNHSDEIDPVVREKIRKLAATGVQLLSQTVLLKNVNDSKDALLSLFNDLISMNIRPYYLHHPDHVKGGMHFYVPLKQGRKIYQTLRHELPGWAIPHYVIDIPGGEGKVSAFNPESTTFSGKLINKDGALIEVKEPDLFH